MSVSVICIIFAFMFSLFGVVSYGIVVKKKSFRKICNVLSWGAASLISPLASFFILYVITGSPWVMFSQNKLYPVVFFIISACISLLIFAVSFYRSTHVPNAFKPVYFLLFAMLVSLLLEVPVFNYRAIQSADYEEYDLTDLTIPDRLESTAAIYSLPNVYIKNIYVEYKNPEIEFVNVRMTLKDKSNQTYLPVCNRNVYVDENASSYIPVNLLSESDSMRLDFSFRIGEAGISKIALNCARPFVFSLSRYLFTAAFLFFFMLLFSKTLFESTLDIKRPAHVFAVFASVFVACLGILALISSNEKFLEPSVGSHHGQFQMLARSFSEGKLYLMEEVPKFLTEMENPYDTGYRNFLVEKYGQSYFWDAAYFDGHYYVYFGVVPIILLYLPYYLITGKDLPNTAAVLVFALLAVIGIFFLIYCLHERFASKKKIRLSEYIVLCFIALLGSGVIFLSSYPDIYSLPIIAAIAFISFGIGLWCLAWKFSDRKVLFSILLCVGALCMALSVGCRPQFVLVSLAAFPIFWDTVFKDRLLLSKKGLIPTLCFAAPYIVVAAGLMWYNFSRFGSPFDFGASYNLTTNDVSNRGFRLDRVGPALFYYIFQPPTIDPTYPFLRSNYYLTTYVGTSISQDIYGGVLFQVPFALLLGFLPRLYGKMKKSRSAQTALLLVSISLVTVILDAQMGGVLQRYICDFQLWIVIASIIVYFHLKETVSKIESGEIVLHRIACAVLVASFVFSTMFVMTTRPITEFFEYLFWL